MNINHYYRLSALLVFALCSMTLMAQAPKGVIIGNGNLDPSAVLQMEADSQGVLLPSLTVDQRDANIINPADALLIYNSTSGVFNKYRNSAWEELDNDWSRRLNLDGSSTDDIYRLNGNVAIGTDQSEDIKLFIKGETSQSPFLIEDSSGGSLLRVYSNGNVNLGSDQYENIKLYIKGETSQSPFLIEDSSGEPLFRILDNGNAGIRTVFSNTDFAVLGREGNDLNFLTRDSDGNDNFIVRANGSTGIRASDDDIDLFVKGRPGSVLSFVTSDSDDKPSFLIRNDGNMGIRRAFNDVDFTLFGKPGNQFFFLIREEGNDNNIFSIGNPNDVSNPPLLLSDENGTNIFRIDHNNNINHWGGAWKQDAGPWGGLSDRRLKKDIEEYTEGLEFIKRIRPVSYSFNGLNNTKEGPRHIGIIAQELQEVAPHMVSKTEKADDGNEYLMVDIGAFTFMLINAVQEQQEEIESLENKYDELLKRIEKLEAE